MAGHPPTLGLLMLALCACSVGPGAPSSPDAGFGNGGSPDGGSAVDGGGGAPDAGEAADGGAGGDGGARATTHWQGTVTGGVTLGSSSFTTNPTPLLSVLWSADNGSTWYANYQKCGGSSAFETDQVLGNGSLSLYPDYCTTSATLYDVRVLPGAVVLHGSLPAQQQLSDPLFDPAVPPLLTVFWSNDSGGSWYVDDEVCAGSLGGTATTHTFQFGGGALLLPQNYCTSAARAYQVVAAPAAKTFTGTIATWPVQISDSVFSSSNPPFVSVFWSEDGKAYFPADEACAGGQSFAMGNGVLVLHSTYCTGSAKFYAVAAQP